MLEGGQKDHHDWRRKQDATGDQAPLLLRENGNRGVDVDDCGTRVDQGHQHQQILKAEDAGLSEVLTPNLQQSDIAFEISFYLFPALQVEVFLSIFEAPRFNIPVPKRDVR